ncbi:unnamed protein product [Sphagnum balticum]
MSEKQTAGKIITDLQAKEQDKATIPEFIEAIGSDFMPKLMAMVEKDKKKADRDFFVEVCISMHPLLAGVPQFFMISRHTCPTPFPDRAAFHYKKKDDVLEFLWMVPSMDQCEYYVQNMLKLRPHEHEAAQNVLDYMELDAPEEPAQEMVENPSQSVQEMVENSAPSSNDRANSPAEQQQSQFQESPKERDWRAVRAQAEEAKHLKREAEAIARERDFYRQQVEKAQQVQQPLEEDYRTDTERQLAQEMADLKSQVAKQREEALKAQQQAAIARAEQRLYADYPDIKEVVSDENIQRLEIEYPHLYNSVIASSDVYNVGSAAYELIKAKGIYKPKANTLNQLAQSSNVSRNQAKPRSVSTVAPQTGETPIQAANNFMGNSISSDAERKALYAEMVASSRNRAF